jgi:hypothetical protein
MRWFRLCLLSAVVTLLTFLCACGGGSSSSGSSGSGSTPDFTLAVSNSPQTVVAGASTTYLVTITAKNGFTGTVTLAAIGLPSGATASFSAIASGSSTLTVTTTTATAAATSTLTVTGTSGTLSHTGTASLVVTPAPDFSIALSSSSSVIAGGTGTYTVTVTALHGFTGTVTLSGTSLPTGVNGWFLPPTVSGAGTSVMNLVTPATLTASTYSFSVSGISNGVTHTASSSLSVTAPTGSFTLSTAPVEQAVTVGGATGYQITVTPSSGFTQDVTLTLSGLPNAASATFTPSTITGGSGTSTVVVSTTSSTVECCYRMTVTGTAGSQTSALTLPLAVIAPGRAIKNVFVITMENQDWSSIKGSGSAPYINNVLLPIGSHAEAYFNPPSMHPDLPNYLWLEAGSNLGVTNNNPPASNSQSTTSHLVTMLTAAGKTWKSYNEGIDGTTCPLTSVAQFTVYTNPFVYFDDVTNTNSTTSATCLAHVVPFSQLSTDLQNNTVANYTFITPNTTDSMGGGSVASGDAWLAANLPTILNSPAYQAGGLILITWDQAVTADGPIGMIVISPNGKGGGYSNTLHYTHGSTLRTVEELLGVTPFLGDAANELDLSDLFISFP